MAKPITPFPDLLADAKTRIREADVTEVHGRWRAGDSFYLIDVREDHEWEQGYLPNAIHLGRGIIDRDIGKAIPNPDAEIILYCGGGARSAMAADVLQKMGYTNVISMDGGFSSWSEAGYEVQRS